MSTNTPAGTPETLASANAGGGGGRSKYHRQIDSAFEEAAKLAGSHLPPAEFYEKFLSTTLQAIDAPAGVVWLRTPQGFLQSSCQQGLDKVGLDDKRGARPCHNEILRQVFQSQAGRPVVIEPQGRLTGVTAEPGAVPAANLTDYTILFAPIIQADKTPLGLLEIFHDASNDPRLMQTFSQFAVQMAGYAGQYHAYGQNRSTGSLERLFAQMDAFNKQIHGTLSPTEVAYHVANEGRRIVECDRLCVGVRHGKYVTVEAVSGADTVEKASTHVRRMKELFDAVLKFGDKLVYRGVQDDGLPPDVSRALDHYLAESQPKLLVVAPIRDEREKENDKPARSVMLLESFNPPEQSEPLISRMDVIAKHAAPALYNSLELSRIPFRFVWTPISKLQETLGGKRRFYTALVLTTLALISLVMVFYPSDLRLPAKGEFLPKATNYVYAPTEGEVTRIAYKPGERVVPGATLIELRSAALEEKAARYAREAATNEALAESYRQQADKADQTDARIQYIREEKKALSLARQNRELLNNLRTAYNLQSGGNGVFTVTAPRPENGIGGDLQVISDDKRAELMNRTVKPNEPLMRVGAVDGPWRVELKLPQRNIGHVARAFATERMHKRDESGHKYLDVDVLLGSQTDRSFPGRLYEDDVAKEAVPNRDDHNEQEPIMLAYVRVNLEEFGPEGQIPVQLRTPGVEARTRIRCGKHALGYSLFHGVWEWFYEKVIFAV